MGSEFKPDRSCFDIRLIQPNNLALVYIPRILRLKKTIVAWLDMRPIRVITVRFVHLNKGVGFLSKQSGFFLPFQTAGLVSSISQHVCRCTVSVISLSFASVEKQICLQPPYEHFSHHHPTKLILVQWTLHLMLLLSRNRFVCLFILWMTFHSFFLCNIRHELTRWSDFCGTKNLYP